MDIREHDLVALTQSLPTHRLAAGDVGTVVHVYANGLQYEVEFFDPQRNTIAIVTLALENIRRGGARNVSRAGRVA